MGGSQLRYGNGALSFHHNLYADNYNASPRLGDNLDLDFVDNVVYDWGTNAGFSTNDISANPSVSRTSSITVCNYLIASLEFGDDQHCLLWRHDQHMDLPDE